MSRESYFGEQDIKPSLNGFNDSSAVNSNSPSSASSLRAAEQRAGQATSQAEQNSVANPVNRTNTTRGETKSSPQTQEQQTLRTLESSPSETQQSFYYNSSEEQKPSRLPFSLSKQNKTHKSRTGFRKALPVAAIAAVLGVALFAIFGSTSLLGAHLESLYTKATDTQYTSSSIRSSRIFTYMLDGGNQLATNWDGTRKYTSFSPWLKSRLKNNGIEVGTVDSSGVFHESSSLTGSKVLKYGDDIISADDFVTTYRDNVEFREAYYYAKRGRVLGFFDDAADSFFKKLGLSRDLMEKFHQTGDESKDTKNYNDTLSKEFDGTPDASHRVVEDQPVLDEDGNETGEYKRVETENTESRSASGASSTERARNYFTKATAVASTACGAWRIGNALATTLAAVEVISSIHYFQNITENLSKSKTEDSDGAAIHQVANFFTKQVSSSYVDPSTGNDINYTGSPLEAESARLILGGVKPNLNNSSPYSIDAMSKSVITALAVHGASASACNISRGMNAVVSLALLSAPGGGFLSLTTSVLIDTIFSIGVQISVTAVLGFMVPTIARVMFDNYFEYLSGIPAGEIYGRGASAANTQLARQASGQSGGSKSAALAYQYQTAEVLALDAELDRRTRSPFDASSENTFLGSLAASFLAFSTTPSLSGALTSFSNLTSSSVSTVAKSLTTPIYAAENTFYNLASINKFAAALADAGENSSYMTTFGSCPTLEEFGVACDMYGNMITTTDLSTIDLDPGDSDYISVISPNLSYDSEGNESIKPNSRLADYIMYCTERDSPFGVYDANIANAFLTDLGFIGNNLPIISQGVDLINLFEEADPEVQAWATGEICMNTQTNTYWGSEMKYYQRYVEDNRILTNMGVYTAAETSDANDAADPLLADNRDPVSLFKKAYYEQHPLDNSDSGLLARLTGLTKTEADDTLDLIAYLYFLEDYDPSTRTVFGSTPKTPASPLHFTGSTHYTYIVYPRPELEYNKVQEVA